MDSLPAEPQGKNVKKLVFFFFKKSFWLPDSSDGKESACNARDPSLIPGTGRFPGEGNVYPLQYFCPENPMDGGAWQSTVHGVAKSWTQLSDFTFTVLYVLVETEK